jgi:hypothetical protein
MDDNNSELEEQKWERERDRVYGPKGDRYERKSGDGMHKRILEALIVAAILALIAAVWQLTKTSAVHQASIDAQRRDFDRMERRQDMLEGKLTRGHALGGTDALDQQ